jgi:tetratricopeptide (TPR) repeat protein
VTRRFLVVPLLAALGGCAVPMIKSGATVKTAELPDQPDKLIKEAEDMAAKQTSADMENALLALDKALKVDPKNFEAAWKAARACTWLADELYDDKNKRAHFSGRGIDYAKAAIDLAPKRVEGHYYSGMNLGLSATTKIVGGKFMVPSVRDAEKKAAQLDPAYDYAGPLRVLGKLYATAPSWPASIGDTSTGIDYLKKAVEIAPNYPLNHLFLGDAFFADEQWLAAQDEYNLVLAAEPQPFDAHFLEKWKRMAREALDKVARKQGSS